MASTESRAFLKEVYEQHFMRIPKYGYHDLANRVLRFWSLWVRFVSCSKLNKLPIWLYRLVVVPRSANRLNALGAKSGE